jgi:hypothetical protein
MRQRLIALLSDLGIACPHVLKEARQNEARPSDVGPAVKPASRLLLTNSLVPQRDHRVHPQAGSG